MQKFVLSVVCLVLVGAVASEKIRSGDNLVSAVLENCYDMTCVKSKVLNYLDTLLGVEEDTRNIKNMDVVIFKRAARVVKTHEFRFRLPEMLGGSDLVYNPISGLDIASTGSESRDILKKKLLAPVLLLLKLKYNVIMPLFVTYVSLKAFKAILLAKFSILLTLGFIIYSVIKKGGMNMPMTMMPIEPTTYSAPAAPSSSYEPGWEANSGGPYSRVWNNNAESAQNVAYSAYYPGSSSTTKP